MRTERKELRVQHSNTYLPYIIIILFIFII